MFNEYLIIHRNLKINKLFKSINMKIPSLTTGPASCCGSKGEAANNCLFDTQAKETSLA
jgi:hypothetical protein